MLFKKEKKAYQLVNINKTLPIVSLFFFIIIIIVYEKFKII